MLVDSHCHLDLPDFADQLDDVVARAGDAGIGCMVTICTRVRQFERILAVAERFDNVWCSVGLHPHDAAGEPELTADRLVELAVHPKVVGIGGAAVHDQRQPGAPGGLDMGAKLAGLHVAGAVLVVIVQPGLADADHLGVDRQLDQAVGRQLRLAGVMHCFSSGRALALAAVELGLYISLSGIVTFKSAEDLRETVRALPVERLLVETDAPYLAPVPNRGRRNEPAFVVHTAAKVAELKALPADELATATTANFFRLFDKAVMPAQG